MEDSELAARIAVTSRAMKAFGIVDEDRIQAIVDNWPTAVDGSRAVRLGLPEPPDLDRIVSQYLDDFGSPVG